MLPYPGRAAQSICLFGFVLRACVFILDFVLVALLDVDSAGRVLFTGLCGVASL